MIRTMLASAATIALVAGAASAQTAIYPEPATAPMAADRAVAAPEAQLEEREAFLAPDPALPPEAPVAAEPVPADPLLAEPVPAEPIGIAQPPVAPGPPVALGYPDLPSSTGLTPGAPLGSDPHSDQKAVVGEDLRTTGPGILFR